MLLIGIIYKSKKSIIITHPHIKNGQTKTTSLRQIQTKRSHMGSPLQLRPPQFIPKIRTNKNLKK